jgi:hypothetical protein
MEMVNFETLALIAVLTSLSTEAVKVLCDKVNVDYVSNIIAAVMSVILSAAVVVVIPAVTGKAAITAELITQGVVMAFFAVLASMLGYDKIRDTLNKIKA